LPEADALIVFSCVGRLVSLGPMSSLEVEGLADVWKKPMIGFFSLGEFGTVPGGKPEFHGTTVSWVALKEK
jgi:small ligand-binding sensory domain FIST